MHRLKSLLCFMPLLLSFSAYAETARFEDWVLECTPEPCILTQSATETPLKVSVTQRQQGLFALIASPLGISLPAGLTVMVDQLGAKRHVFATCTVGGCLSAIPLVDDDLRAWQRGRLLQVSYQDGAGSSITASISLLGFTAGHAALLAAGQTP
ncbi:MAG: invasion associated locus B family protein [Hyphomicrobiales bacterium]